jgi:ferredoxin, 2Fe-2S
MARITYVSHDGTRTEIEVRAGYHLMEAAVAAGLPGIVGECGGSMMCATCHVYVDPARMADLPPVSPTEDAMLDSTLCDRQANSRLSCQLVASDVMDGLVVTMPERQR